MEAPMLKVIIIEPKESPIIKEIPDTLEGYQKIVGGYIEAVFLEGGYVLVCNEEGKLTGLELNFPFGNDIIVGTAFITKSDDEGDFVSLSELDEVKVITMLLKEWSRLGHTQENGCY